MQGTLAPEIHADCAVCANRHNVATLEREPIAQYFEGYITGKMKFCRAHLEELIERDPQFEQSPQS